MANNKMIIEERLREVGNFLVGRLLPFRKKRQVGPFTFIDHMGPAHIEAGQNFDVDQHPHIGLSTLTYLFKGSVEHKDSTGGHAIINPGDVAFMTSGKGVAHSERTPQNLRNSSYEMHGYQVWVALPKELEEMDPRFDYFPKEELPHWEENGLSMTMVIGSGFDKKSPLQGYSPMFMVDVLANKDAPLILKERLKGETAIVVVDGKLKDGEETFETGKMLISKTNEQCQIQLSKGTRVLIFGGEPLTEERYMLWNFVSSSKERLQQAKQDWIDRKFPKIEGDDTYIPFP